MDSSHKNIFAFNVPSSPASQQSKVNIILLGNCGVGKSLLLNNLCQSQQKVGISKRSVTEDLFWAQCKNVSLCVVDTPGVEKTNNLTSLTLRRALRSLNWNLVVIMAKLDSRFEDNTLTQLRILSRPFKNDDSKKVVFMVSHLDILDNLDGNSANKEETLAAFENNLRENDFKEPVILFSNHNSDFEGLSKILYNCGSQVKPSTFSLDDKQFCRALGFPNSTDPQQQLISDLLQRLEEKLALKKQLTKQDVRSVEFDDREAFLSKFDEAERKSVKALVDCFLENWIANNVIQKSEESQRDDIKEQNQNQEDVQPPKDDNPKEKSTQLQIENKNKNKDKYTYVYWSDRTQCRQYYPYSYHSRSFCTNRRKINQSSIYGNNIQIQRRLKQVQRRKEQRDLQILLNHARKEQSIIQQFKVIRYYEQKMLEEIQFQRRKRSYWLI